MANTIQIKRGSGSSEPSSLAEGELAINLDSGKLFYGSGSSVLSDFKVDTLTAETYVVSSSVTHMTTSFSSGSTAFGDTADDTHTFTGTVVIPNVANLETAVVANTAKVTDRHFVFDQGVATSSWSINHSLGKYPSVIVIDSAKTMVIGAVTYVDSNNLTIKFRSGFSGKAYLN